VNLWSFASEPGCCQQRAEDALGGKIFPGERSRLTAVTGIISHDCIDSSERLFMGGVFEEAAADRIEFAKSRADAMTHRIVALGNRGPRDSRHT